jgi:hypothetical protein
MVLSKKTTGLKVITKAVIDVLDCSILLRGIMYQILSGLAYILSGS